MINNGKVNQMPAQADKLSAAADPCAGGLRLGPVQQARQVTPATGKRDI
jgi:hypothetical protein